MHRFAGTVAGALVGLVQATSIGVELPPPHGDGLAARKDATAYPDAAPLLGTLVQTHSDERIALDEALPTEARFEALMMDRVTAEAHPMDGKLLALLRTLAARHPGARIELVSGYRSPKLNEMLRKKGHHVASHSQHSLGHACDFRLVEAGQSKGLDPRDVERELRSLGWDGGVGVYRTETDWFVHADVGPNRRWDGY
jgi:uncharacterized protein YcbK (DUF882 family)